MKVWRGISLLPAFGAASLTLAHIVTAAAFRRKTREIFARLENMAAAEVQAAPVPAIIQSFASRAVGRNPVPRAVWLCKTGEMRAAADSPWRPVHCRAGDQHSPTSLCLGRSDAIGAAPRDAHPRVLCRWEGSARSAALRFIAAGPDGGPRGQQGRVDAVPRGARLGAACHSLQPASVPVRNRCKHGRSVRA